MRYSFGRVEPSLSPLRAADGQTEVRYWGLLCAAGVADLLPATYISSTYCRLAENPVSALVAD